MKLALCAFMYVLGTEVISSGFRIASALPPEANSPGDYFYYFAYSYTNKWVFFVCVLFLFFF